MNFVSKIQNKHLRKIAEKAQSNTPITQKDALCLLTTNDILDLGYIANHIKHKLHGDIIYYGVNMNLNYTNVCELRCPLCAYSCDENDKNAFLLSLDEIEKKVKQAVDYGADEIHIVGGLHPKLTLDYFEKMIRLIKRIKPGMNIVAFTVVEYDYFAKKNNLTLEEIFKLFKDFGVNALPGGGAEIFDPNVRKIIAPSKISGEKWIDIMRTAHRSGFKTNATMLYNHIESNDDIINHLSNIRELQNETQGFKTFVPLCFHKKNTKIKTKHTSTGYNDIRIYATSRIFLHNIPHLKALWMYIGEKMAQTLLNFGVDDIGATYHHETIVHAAGAKTPDYGSETFLRRLITKAKMSPQRTTANYTSLESLDIK